VKLHTGTFAIRRRDLISRGGFRAARPRETHDVATPCEAGRAETVRMRQDGSAALEAGGALAEEGGDALPGVLA
jgi:hypothetical protein